MSEARPLQPGDPAQVGDYEIVGRLGEGGLGVVYLGLSPAGGSVAIRVLRLHSLSAEAARTRFLGELQVARRIAASCVAQVIDTGVIGDAPYIVSEFVRGPSLEQLVATEGPRGRRALERLAVGTATALAALHRAGVVHRDLRPANVLLASDGPRLIDVGIARALEAAGTPAVLTLSHAYLAPEQSPVGGASGGMGGGTGGGTAVGPATDVFAWGSTIVFGATGQPPFGHGTGPEVMDRITHREPVLDALPETLRGVVADALAKDPAQRPTAREVLDRLLGEESTSSGMPERKIAEARSLATGDGPEGAAYGSGAYGGGAYGGSPSSTSYADSSYTAASYGDTSYGSTSYRDTSYADASYGADETTVLNTPAPADPADDRTVGLDALLGREDAAPIRPGGGAGDTTIQRLPAAWPDGPALGADYSGTGGTGGGGTGGTGGGGTGGTGPGSGTGIGTGLGRLRDLAGGERSGRPSNRVLGVAGAVAIGLITGILLITLVISPQIKGDAGGSPKSTSTAAAVDDTPVRSIPAGFKGTWRGTATNQDGRSFQVTAVFKEGQTTATVLYTPMNCAGSLTLTSGTRSKLEMALTVRPCTNGNVTITRQADGSLLYAWRHPSSRHHYRATLRTR